METFENLEVWSRACRLSVDVYGLLCECREYGFKDQLFRSALSIPSNIAEGYERGSRSEFIRFLNIAKGSSGELRTQLYVGIKAGLLDEKAARRYLQESTEISKMLQGLINKLQTEE
jgi:four helix bundle protein